MNSFDSLRAIFVLLQIGALTQWRLTHGNKFVASKLLQVYALLTVLVSGNFFIYGLIAGIDINMSSSGIGETVDFMLMLGIRLAHVATVSEAFLRRHKERQFYESIREIDDILERYLNITVDNVKFQRHVLRWGAFLVLLYIGSELFVMFSSVLFPRRQFLTFWLYYILPFFIVGLRFGQYFAIIGLVRSRFELLHQQLQMGDSMYDSRQVVKANAAVAPSYAISSIDWAAAPRHADLETHQLRHLLILRDVYNRLWELCSLVNATYGISILIAVANDFVTIVANCYWIFLSFKEAGSQQVDYMEIAAITIWSLPHFVNLVILAFSCEGVLKCTSNIALALHLIRLDSSNDNHNTLIEQFSLQLLHQKVKFSAAGFFDIDCSLLYTIVGATTTYLIILIQFNMGEQKKGE